MVAVQMTVLVKSGLNTIIVVKVKTVGPKKGNPHISWPLDFVRRLQVAAVHLAQRGFRDIVLPSQSNLWVYNI